MSRPAGYCTKRATARLYRDAAKVVRRLLKDATAEQIAREYGVGESTVGKLYRSRTTPAQRARATRGKTFINGRRLWQRLQGRHVRAEKRNAQPQPQPLPRGR